MASAFVSSSIVHLAASIALCFVGCTSRTAAESDGSGSASSTGPSAAETTHAGDVSTTGFVASSTTFADSTGADSDDGITSVGFCNLDEDEYWHCQPDGGGVLFECDVMAQDCPEGEKCMPWANDGGSAWNASRCSPVAPTPAQPGEACTVEGSAVSGVDSCDLGSMCWGVDPVTLQGECVAHCGGDRANPVCGDADALCVFHNGGALVVCLPSCNPLAPACDANETCIPEPSGAWACVPSITTSAADGDPCQFGNVCGPGSVCASPSAVPDCEGALGCCAPTCDVNVGGCADAEAECTAWYPLGAPPSLEAVGLCVDDPTLKPRSGWVDHGAVPLVANAG